MTERALQASIVRYLNAQPNTMARVNGPGPAHIVGDPDIYGCVGGLMFQMEVKQEKGLVTPLQQHMLEKWLAAGARCFVVRSLSEAKRAHAEAWMRAVKLKLVP